MIADKILGNINSKNSSKELIPILFDWFELSKHRILKSAADGTNIGIQIEDPLNEGDIISETENKIYYVKSKPTKLIVAIVNSLENMGRLCFELGNRHLPLQIKSNVVKVPYDNPTFEYLKHIGFNVNVEDSVFSDYIVCKAHGH